MKLFFDLDGTLIDVSKRHYTVYSELIEEFGGIALAQPEYWKLKRQKTPWPELLVYSGLALEALNDFLESFISKIEAVKYLKLDSLTPGSLELLAKLAKKHDCYLVSLRRNQINLHAELDWLELTSLFTGVLSGHSETDGSDVKTALIKGALADKDAVIIGDTEADIMTGKNLGIRTVAVLSGIRDEEFLRALQPDRVINNVAVLGDGQL